ncbi:hypothetical protein HOY80DRAFT_1112439 [Tuber brumale]|nr:hypothetical protein HOY80DRAFT_1112439 [Tuber brumale]
MNLISNNLAKLDSRTNFGFTCDTGLGRTQDLLELLWPHDLIFAAGRDAWGAPPFSTPKMPAEEALYARVAQRTAHPEGVGVEEEGRDEDFRTGGSHRLFLTPPSHWSRSVRDVSHPTSAIVNLTHRALGGPHFQFSPINSKKKPNKRELTIPVNPTNIPMSGIDADVFFTTVMPGLYARCLGSLAGLRGLLGGDCVLGRDGGSRVLRMCSIWGVGEFGYLLGRVLSKRKRRRKDELPEGTGKPPPCPGGKALPVVRERSGLRAVVVEALGRYSVYSSSAGYLFRKPTLQVGRPGGEEYGLAEKTLRSDHCYKQNPSNREIAFPPLNH